MTLQPSIESGPSELVIAAHDVQVKAHVGFAALTRPAKRVAASTPATRNTGDRTGGRFDDGDARTGRRGGSTGDVEEAAFPLSRSRAGN